MDKHGQLDCAERAAADERRRHERQAVMSLDCSHGIVVNFSAGGLSVVSRKPLEGSVDLVLKRGAGPEVRVVATVVWTKRVGFSEHLNGLEFADGSQNIERRLGSDAGTDPTDGQDGA
jgi:hypothetical protein